MLNFKQKRFAEEYLIDMNATAAAKRAGYSSKTSRAIGMENLTKPDIRKYIQERQKVLQDKLQITQERVLQEYARIAFFDIRKIYSDDNTLVSIKDMSDDVAACLSGVEVDEIFSGVGKDREIIGNTTKVKLANKIAALDSLGKHLGLFSKDNEQKKTETPPPFTNEQVNRLIDEMRKNKSTTSENMRNVEEC